MLFITESEKAFDSGYPYIDGKVLLESGVFIEYEKPNGEIVVIDGARIYFEEECEKEMRDRAKKAFNEVASVINRLITHVRNGNPENKLEFTIINNLRCKLNDHSPLDENWVISNFRELHIEAHHMGLS